MLVDSVGTAVVAVVIGIIVAVDDNSGCVVGIVIGVFAVVVIGVEGNVVVVVGIVWCCVTSSCGGVNAIDV